MTDKLLVEQSMRVAKASFDKSTGTMRLRMVTSDTGYDIFGERMSLELFNDFTSRIEKSSPVPEPYKSILAEKSGWDGGLPYVSVSHFKSGIEGKNIAADTEKVYVDGEMLKSTAVCRNTALGNAVFQSIKADLEGKSSYEDKIRVSIGFLDLSHSHGDYVFERKGLASSCPMCENGDGNKVYLKGILVHNALTRVPANPRTDAEVDKSMSIETKKEDAASIVGEDLAAEMIKNKSAIDDAEVEDILTVKAKAPVIDDEEDEDVCTGKPGCVCKACASKKKKEETKSQIVEESIPVLEVIEPVAVSAIDDAVAALKNRIVELKSLPREQALKEIQSTFDALGQVVQNEFVEQKSAVVTVTIDPALAELLTSMKSTLDSVNAKMGALSDEVTILKSQIATTGKSSPSLPAETIRRNLQVERTNSLIDAGMAMKPKSILEIARASVQG